MSVDTTVAKTRGFSEEALNELSWARGEPEWLRQRRLEAWRAYERMPMPSRRDEEWRRTDLSMLDLAKVTPFSEQEGRAQRLEDLPEALRALLRDGDAVTAQDRHSRLRGNDGTEGRGNDGAEGLGGLLVQRNSAAAYRHLGDDLAARGVIATDLASASREHEELVRRHLGAHVGPTESKFAALHSAFWGGGAFVYVPRNVEVELPIHSLTWADAPGLGVMPHTLVVVESGASLTFVDEQASGEGGDPAMANGVVELAVGDGAQLRYISLQRWGSGVFNFEVQRASVGRDARLATLSVVLGSRMTKSWIESMLRQSGASVQMSGITFAGGGQRIHHHTLQDHQAPSTTSDLLFKSVLTDRARSEYSGLIRVHKDAQRTDAYQANRNLLLSDRSRADSMPKLEIENNDVRCTHGATVGPIDPEQVFYLMARGLPRSEAQGMIVRGFFEPLLERIPLEGVRNRVREAVDERLAASH